MEVKGYYLFKIREDLARRQRLNPHYSLRAYARDIGVHPATLSQILKGTRPLPLKNSESVTTQLRLGPRERTLFVESLIKTKTRLDEIHISLSDERFMLDDSHYKIISEWEHYALLDLFDLTDFEVTVDSVSKKLDLTQTRTKVVIHNLKVGGLLTQEPNGNLKRVHESIRTTEDVFNPALREAHRETLQIGLQKLEQIEVELRDFSSMTLAVDLEKIPHVKAIIREFRQKMQALLKDGKKSEVYQLAIQFYPISKITTKKTKKGRVENENPKNN